ncbi:MAG: helix-turn-helix domain-containing protein [Gammaproteobacteria bacterium]|nr:helix-turn-helix domain-containing protein [Gammaproteobacteria bacterium]
MRLRRLEVMDSRSAIGCVRGQGRHISKLERDDDTDPKLSTIYKLMNALGCSADDLLTDGERVGPSGRLQGAFKRAEELPEERQEIILHWSRRTAPPTDCRRCWATRWSFPCRGCSSASRSRRPDPVPMLRRVSPMRQRGGVTRTATASGKAAIG